jgi:hypothetical protein
MPEHRILSWNLAHVGVVGQAGAIEPGIPDPNVQLFVPSPFIIYINCRKFGYLNVSAALNAAPFRRYQIFQARKDWSSQHCTYSMTPSLHHC